MFTKTNLVGYKLEQKLMFDKLDSLHNIESVITVVGQNLAAHVSDCGFSTLKHLQQIWTCRADLYGTIILASFEICYG